MDEGRPIRPDIFASRSIPDYVRAMIEWRRRTEPGFTVSGCADGLRRCSPALVTRVSRGQRKLTSDRVDAFARLLGLSAEEKVYLESWVRGADRAAHTAAPPVRERRKRDNHLLRDWLNVYVREASRLRAFRADSGTVHGLLDGIASPGHVERSLRFLLREGYLRRTLDGRVVQNDPVVTTSDGERNDRIRAFHSRALEVARRNLARHPMERRRESALVLALNRESVSELKELLKEFYERLLSFAEAHLDDDEALYQVTVHLTPLGGHFEEDPNR